MLPIVHELSLYEIFFGNSDKEKLKKADLDKNLFKDVYKIAEMGGHLL